MFSTNLQWLLVTVGGHFALVVASNARNVNTSNGNVSNNSKNNTNNTMRVRSLCRV